MEEINYILSNLEKDILEANSLEDKVYLEMSKKEIIDSLNYTYKKLKCWKEKYNDKKYIIIIKEYKEIEAIISQLELCLADYDTIYHMEGISYSLFQIGKKFLY